MVLIRKLVFPFDQLALKLYFLKFTIFPILAF